MWTDIGFEKVYLFALQGVRPVVGFLAEGLP